jgi:lysophospholipid acyltransferase (LPLAT)-like uncharacterized protein
VLRALLGTALGLVVRLWARSWRISVVAPNASSASAPRVFAFWHGQQMALTRVTRSRPTAVMVSWSKDGALQASVMKSLGLGVVRGSASRGGAQGLRKLVRIARRGSDLAFAADGPRGPAGVAKPGAAAAAALVRGSLVAVASAASPVLMLRRAWDLFEIPLPFARVVVVFGAPLSVAEARRDASVLSDAIFSARRQALGALGRRPDEATPDGEKSGSSVTQCPPS